MNKHDVHASSGVLVGRWPRVRGRSRFIVPLGLGEHTGLSTGHEAVGPTKRAAGRRRFVTSAIGALVVAAVLAPVAATVAQAETTGVLGIDPNRRYDANTYLGTHNSYAAQPNNWGVPNQDSSVYDQLEKGVRVLNFDVYVGRQDPGFQCVEVYLGDSTDFGQGDANLPTCHQEAADPLKIILRDEPLEVFTAHRPAGYGFIPHTGRFDTLSAELNPVHQWMSEHPREIVTMVFENFVATSNQGLVDEEMRKAGFGFWPGCTTGQSICIFDPTAKGLNPGLPIPGRPGAAWNVSRNGFPTLNQMADANYRFVLFRQINDNMVRTKDDTVQESSAHWADARDEPIDNYKLPILLVEHQPCCPGLRPVSGIEELNYNGEARVVHHWDDINARWHRMPQIIWFDFFDQDGEHPNHSGNLSNPTGAMKLIKDLNLMRGSLPTISAAASVAGVNQFGWSRSNAFVSYSASGDSAFRVIRNVYPNGADDPFELHDGCVNNVCQAADLIEAEGSTTVSFAAVGNNGLGVRSSQAYVEVKIDRTAPTISASASSGGTQYTAGSWTNKDVTVSFNCTDALSGVADVAPPVTLTGEGANQTASGICHDRADNAATAAFGPVNIDKTGAQTRLGSVQSGGLTGTATDNLSGVAKTEVRFVSLLGQATTRLATCTGGCATTSATWTASLSGLLGAYRVTATSTDTAGNVGPASPAAIVVVA